MCNNKHKRSNILTICKSLNSHVIVIDDVSENLAKVRLRDPYHGWEITVKSEAFLKEWTVPKGPGFEEIIQIPKTRPLSTPT